MNISISEQQFWSVMVFLVAAAVVVTNLVDALRLKKEISDVNAGKINRVVSFFAALVGFLFLHFGHGDMLAQAQGVGAEVSLSLLSAPIIMFLAWLIHQIIKLAEGGHSILGKPLTGYNR